MGLDSLLAHAVVMLKIKINDVVPRPPPTKPNAHMTTSHSGAKQPDNK